MTLTHYIEHLLLVFALRKEKERDGEDDCISLSRSDQMTPRLNNLARGDG